MSDATSVQRASEPADAIGSFVTAVKALTAAQRERDEARNHLQAVREFAHGLGASTATRAQILDACTRLPFAPEGQQ